MDVEAVVRAASELVLRVPVGSELLEGSCPVSYQIDSEILARRKRKMMVVVMVDVCT